MKKIILALTCISLLAACNNESIDNKTSENQPVATEKANEEKSAETTDSKVVEVTVTDVDENEDVEAEEEEPAAEKTEAGKETSENMPQNEEKSNTKEAVNDNLSETAEEAESAEDTPAGQVANTDYFYMGYNLVTVDENGRLVDETANPDILGSELTYFYVKYSNNLYVRDHMTDLHSEIVRVKNDEITSIYELAEGEEFIPLGLIDDKIYGIHTYYSKEGDEQEQFYSLIEDKSALAIFDLATAKLTDYEKTRGAVGFTAALADDRIEFLSSGTDINDIKLCQLDITKDLDQDYEVLEEGTNTQRLYGQKHFVDGNPSWNILRADAENIYTADKTIEAPLLQHAIYEVIGNNLFTQNFIPYAFEEEEEIQPAELIITNLSTGEEVLKAETYGYKIEDGKLYYLNDSFEVSEADIEL